MRYREMYTRNDGATFDTVGVEWTWRGRRWRATATDLETGRWVSACGRSAQEAWDAVEPAKPALAVRRPPAVSVEP